jgi:hypothetical protein
LRRAELVSLDRANFDAATSTLKVIGKGNKQRSVYLTDGALDAVAAWLAVRGDDPGPLLYTVGKGGRVHPRRLTTSAVYDRLRFIARVAGTGDVSPHDLRRSFVSDLLDAGKDISTVAKLAGHAQIQTTARYDRRDEHAKRRAVAALYVPFHRPDARIASPKGSRKRKGAPCPNIAVVCARLRAYHLDGPVPRELLARLPAVLHISDTGRSVRRGDVDALPAAERRHLWFETTGEDGEGTRTLFPFYDDSGVFAWKPGDPR